MYSVCHNYLFILLFQMLETGFSLTRPSSGQYLQKLKNAGAFNITCQYHGIPFTVIIVLYSLHQL
jgi:hypothetical protein